MGSCLCISGRVGSDNVFALTSLRGQAEEQICKFFRSIDLKSLEPRRFALNLGLEYLENFFFSIPWIDALPDQLKKQMTQKMTAGLPGSEQHFPGSFFELDFEF